MTRLSRAIALLPVVAGCSAIFEPVGVTQCVELTEPQQFASNARIELVERMPAIASHRAAALTYPGRVLISWREVHQNQAWWLPASLIAHEFTHVEQWKTGSFSEAAALRAELPWGDQLVQIERCAT